MTTKSTRRIKGKRLSAELVAQVEGDDTCFQASACALIRERLSVLLDVPSTHIHCDTRLKDIGYEGDAVGGLAPMVNTLRHNAGKPDLPMSEVAKAKTVGDLCKLVA